jgi:WD40 repeat protein
MILHHDAGVTHAAFNPNGDRIVTSSFDNTARIWNVRDGSEIAVLKGINAPCLEWPCHANQGT